MAASLKPYSTGYKESGIEWLGEVPGHWEVRRAKSLFKKIERPIQKEDEIITCFRNGTVTLRRNRRVSGFTESLKEIGYQGICAGDLVIHSMDAFAGAIGVADSNGKGSPVYSVCTSSSQVNDYFYAYTLREMAHNGWIQALAKGIRERSSDFRYTDFAVQLVSLPTLSEQTAIVRYLDHSTDCIDRYIHAKEKLISLLAEQKQVIIHQAVTGQIDVRTGQPYPAYKDSGVEWLGEVPEHWNISRLRVVVSILNGATPSTVNEEYWNGKILWLTPEDLGALNTRRISESTRKITPAGYASCGTSLAQQNSIAVSTRAPIGHLGILNSEGCTNQGCKLLVPGTHVLEEYLYDVLESARSELQSLGNGTTFSELSKINLGDFRLPLPPLPEQTAIARFLDKTSSKIDESIARAQRKIELLREYRERLISDVVTGKLDVREAATRLPQEADNPASIGSSDDLSDSVEENSDMESIMSGTSP